MGWIYRREGKQSDVMAGLLRTNTYNGQTRTVIEHKKTAGILWTVEEVTQEGKAPYRYIGCYLLQGLGYKAMSEEMHPYYYDCPLRFLDLVPVACQEWRDGVGKYHGEDQPCLAL